MPRQHLQSVGIALGRPQRRAVESRTQGRADQRGLQSKGQHSRQGADEYDRGPGRPGDGYGLRQGSVEGDLNSGNWQLEARPAREPEKARRE